MKSGHTQILVGVHVKMKVAKETDKEYTDDELMLNVDMRKS